MLHGVLLFCMLDWLVYGGRPRNCPFKESDVYWISLILKKMNMILHKPSVVCSTQFNHHFKNFKFPILVNLSDLI